MDKLTNEEKKSLDEFILSLKIKPFVDNIRYKFIKRDPDGKPHIHFYLKMNYSNVGFNAEFFEEE